MISKYLPLIVIIALALFLRFQNLTLVPPSLYWDEVSQAYNSYSILKTGRDEHREFMPIAKFQAFGDYKAPVYIYLDVIAMALFGKTEFAVRFPSAFFGTLTVLMTYLLTIQLFIKDKNRYGYALATSFLLAISPWHIQLSRAAYEANIATFFTVTAIFLFFFAKNKNPWLYLPSSGFFIIGMYAFNAHRVFIPLILLLLGTLYLNELKKSLKQVVLAGIIALLLLLPFIAFLTTPESRLRFNEVNIFSDLNIIKESNEKIESSGHSLTSRLLDNRRVLFAREYAKHYLDFFNPTYLFFTGDENPRFSLQDNGILYFWELPFLLLGTYVLIKRRDRVSVFILAWFLLAPLGAATARETPHALRALTYIPTYQILGGIGLLNFILFLKNTKHRFTYYAGVSMLACIIFATLLLFVHNYFNHFPQKYAEAWQYGYKEAVKEAEARKGDYDEIIFTPKYGRPYIYVLFYANISPEEYWKTGVKEKDQFGFYNVSGIGKYKFTNPSNISTAEKRDKKILFIIGEDELESSMHVLKKIYFPRGDTAFVIAESK